MKNVDYTGQSFGKLVVIKRVNRNTNSVFLLCRCECKNEKVYRLDRLKTRQEPTCGCGKYGFKIGDKVGKLTILDNLGKIKKNVGKGSQSIYWLCVCECGKEGKYTSSYIYEKSKRGCLSCYEKSMTGKVFGRLTITGKITNKRNIRFYECLCECGNLIEVSTGHLISGHTTSCGCGRVGNSAYIWTGCGDIGGYIFGRIKYGALSRGIEYNIDKKDMWELFLDQNCRCALTKKELNFGPTKQRTKEGNISLDRIDSSKDYNKDNVQWVHKIVNKMKGELTQEEFIYWCNLVALHNPLPKEALI